MRQTSLPTWIETFYIAFILTTWLGFASTSSRLEKIHMPLPDTEMEVALPRFMQVLLAGGDRFLATNLTVFRSLTVDTQNNQPGRFAVQAKIQKDAAYLNPYHEDNYYLAAANLSWNQQLDTAQDILAMASEVRRFDILPPFFYAFNQFYFRHDPKGGSEWLRIAADHAQNEKDKLAFSRIAANWMVKSRDRHQALVMLRLMAEQSRYTSLKRQILQRAERVEHLIELDNAIGTFHGRYHQFPENLESLVSSRIISRIPLDPMGEGYTIDNQGKAQIKTVSKK